MVYSNWCQHCRRYSKLAAKVVVVVVRTFVLVVDIFDLGGGKGHFFAFSTYFHFNDTD